MADEIKIAEKYRKRRNKRVNQVAVAVGGYASLHLCKEPQHTSIYTGKAWVRDVLQGHSTRCYNMFRMEREVFFSLCTELQQHGLRETRNVGIHEMVAILAMTNIKPKDPTFQHLHTKIRPGGRYWPFFKHAIGAIDGTHISCIVDATEQTKFINRKGRVTQNVMAVCDWDMCFTFVLARWEGSAHDARIFDHALTTPSMNFPHPPQGKYYLVDAGYPTPMGYLGPYRRERYHLPDFRRSSALENDNEAFNYLHSSLRSTIERTFGVWKSKFAILGNMPSYDFATQVQIVCATMAIHNFIRSTSISDPGFIQFEQEGSYAEENDDDGVGSSHIPSSVDSSSHMVRLRDSIRDQIIHYIQE
ncbi:uncharacterized protein LOC114746446 [Neltuma alba]|uniref:uncharacterized protein LOC114746446 n=1 Tax=Neltuma alba TaxID=207710 RepID=UPI0010A547BE|nr:uncharacterized protein LOC114746446 [Prosopis alba]